MSKVFPPRNLGIAEKWGREVESRILSIESTLSGLRQLFDNLGRHSSSQDTIISRQIADLTEALDTLSRNQETLSDTQGTLSSLLSQAQSQQSQISSLLSQITSNQQRITQTISSGSFSGSAGANAWGTSVTVARPSWASRAVVIAGFTSLPSGASWIGDIEIITANATPGTGDIGASRDAARAIVPGAGALSNPRIVQFSSSGTTPVYIRPRGTRTSGTATGTYSFNVGYSVIWS